MSRSPIAVLCGVMLLGAGATMARAQVDVHDQWPAAIHPSRDANGAVTWNDDGVPPSQMLKKVEIDPALRALVKQLEDPNFEVREQASRKLGESSPDPIQLYALLAQDQDLTAEQRYRLLDVLHDALVNTPRGAIGISMQPFPANFGNQLEIRVTDLLPGLPAERVLKLGDRITSVDGKPLTAYDDLQFRVQSKKPGDKVRLIVKRTKTDEQGRPLVDENNQPVEEVLNVELELGSADLLQKFNQPLQMNQLNQPFAQMPTRVEQTRERAAEQARQRYSPAPRSINIPNDSTLIARADSRSGATSDDEAELDPEVEAYPIIQQMRMQHELIREGKYSNDQLRVIAQQWQLQLRDLYRQLQDSHLTNEQRDLRKRVIERFVELMQF